MIDNSGPMYCPICELSVRPDFDRDYDRMTWTCPDCQHILDVDWDDSDTFQSDRGRI